jgi:uracil phosphoribosyltransferase
MKQSDLELSVHVIRHPVLQHKLAVMRDRKTSPFSFRMIMEEISQFLAYEASRDFPTTKTTIETPMEKLEAEVVANPPMIVSVMRAGNGMLSGMMRILPFSPVGHIGIYRDKFIKTTVEYYFRLPKNSKGRKVLLLDPLLATGDTACAAIERLKQYKVGAIRYVCLLAAPEGIQKIKEMHPDVEIYTTSIERELNASGYILPGLGDAGDRLYEAAT